MYTATMIYEFQPEDFDHACDLWKNHIFDLAGEQPGFISMELLVNSPKALAIGTWKDQKSARAFMELGVFKQLMEVIQPMVVNKPQPLIWEPRYSTREDLL